MSFTCRVWPSLGLCTLSRKAFSSTSKTSATAPSPRRARILRFYRDCVRRQLYCNGADRIHLSKNPTFSGRVESLIEAFPDARFVVNVRDPNETIPSLLKMMTRNWKAAKCSRERIDDSRRALAEQSFHTYRHPLDVLVSIAQDLTAAPSAGAV